MTFLQPILLLLGILAGIPFLIHLMGEKKYHPVAFSSLKFLREIERESLQKLHLRQWLILISRASWIIMLVLALALPFSNFTGGKIRTGIMLIDRSISTQEDPSYIELDKNINNEYKNWQIIDYNENSQIDSLKADIEHIIDLEGLIDPDIIWVTDCQDNEQNQNIVKMLNGQSDRVYTLCKTKSSTNYSVNDIKLQDIYNQEMNTLLIKASSNKKDNNGLAVFVGVNGKQIGQAVTFNGNASYSFSKLDEYESMCTVNSRDDDYPMDNKRYIVIRNYKQIKMLCINDPSEANYHIKALKAMAEIELTEIRADEITTIDMNDYDIIWFSGSYYVNENTLERLEVFSLNRPLVITANKSINPGDLWFDICGNVGEPKRQDGYIAVTDESGNEIPGMKIRRYFTSDKIPQEVLWKTDNEIPLLINATKNTYVLLSPFNFKWNEMGLSPYFTRELGGIIDHMLKREGNSYNCGDPIPLPGSFSIVTTPTGEKFRVRDQFTETKTAGFYGIAGDGKTRTVAMNIPQAESIQQMISGEEMDILDWDGTNIGELHRLIKGRDSQTLFFILAVVFIILEMLLLRKGERTK